MALGDPEIAATAGELLQRHKELHKLHTPIAHLDERPAGAPVPKVFIFCCFDPRVDPAQFLGLNQWDALVVRNVGGNVSTQIQNLVYVDQLLGSITDVFVIQHTNCGATMLKRDDVRAHLAQNGLGTEPEIDGLWIPTYEDIEQRVRDNVSIIKTSPFIRGELKARTMGFVYDLKTGSLDNIV